MSPLEVTETEADLQAALCRLQRIRHARWRCTSPALFSLKVVAILDEDGAHR